MKAVVYTRYGPPDVLRLADIDKPEPGAEELLIRVRAATVAAADVNARGFVFVPPGLGPVARLIYGLRRPRQAVLGAELAGEVEAVGSSVTRFRKGDRVFAFAGGGAYAEYVTLPASGTVALAPAAMSDEEAATLPVGATTALFFLRDKAKLRPGQSVLVIGASGSVGTYAVQLAKHFGATVTGVSSTANLELVRSLGADAVLDYTVQEIPPSGALYDVIFDTVGKSSFFACRASLTPQGRYLAGAGGLRELLLMAWTAAFGRRKVIAGAAPDRTENLLFLKDLAEAKRIRAVIDRRYRLEEIVDAHRYVDTGHKRGNVVITV
jgi:NADPH:quinone reductase-like Zn-dependent oxidoreductase